MTIINRLTSYKLYAACVFLLLLAICIRFASYALDSRQDNWFTYLGNTDEITFTKIIRRYEHKQIPANRLYAPAFPTVALLAHSTLKNLSTYAPQLLSKTNLKMKATHSISVLCRILTTVLIFLCALKLFRNSNIAIYSTLFYTFAPLANIHSFYATADNMNTFMLLLATFLIITAIERKNRASAILASVTTGVAVATKMTFSLFIPFAYLLHACVKNESKRSFWMMLFICSSCLIVGFVASFGVDIPYIHKIVKSVGNNALNDNISVKDHWHSLNPLNYLIQLSVGLGLPSFIFAFYGGSHWLRFSRNLRIMLLAMVSHLCFISTLSIPTNRHALPLIPFFCIFAGIGLELFLRKIYNEKRRHLPTLVLACCISYQALATFSLLHPVVIANHNFELRTWIAKNVSQDERVFYRNISSLGSKHFKRVKNLSQANIAIISSRYAMKLTRSQINPWGNPTCSGKIFHANKRACMEYQELILKEKDFYLTHTIASPTFVPEHWLFERIWNAYDWFEQKYYIYKRKELS